MFRKAWVGVNKIPFHNVKHTFGRITSPKAVTLQTHDLAFFISVVIPVIGSTVNHLCILSSVPLIGCLQSLSCSLGGWLS